MTRILVDTDIGDVVDDAYCLAYLLTQPDAQLVGITTVGGEPGRRAALADALSRATRREDVPVIAGCGQTLGMRPLDVPLPQTDVVERFAHRAPEAFEPNRAVDFMVESILASHGELTSSASGRSRISRCSARAARTCWPRSGASC